MVQGIRPGQYAAIALSLLVGACSDVQVDTYEVQLTTDLAPRTVELWDTFPMKYRYSLRFPHAFYVYRDNHYYLKQTTIALLLDRASFRPWTQIVASETGITEPLNYPSRRISRLKPAAIRLSNRDPRQMMVTISGKKLGGGRRESIRMQHLPDENIVIWNGFRSVVTPVPNSKRAYIHGYSVSGPLVWVQCSGDVNVDKCSFRRYWRGSEISFNLHPDDAREALQVSERLVRLLERHLVPRGQT